MNLALFFRHLQTISIVFIAGSLLSACAEAQFVMATAKRLNHINKPQGSYKVGKPYQVAGVWYYPSEDLTYDRTGIASWYGPNFDGKPTANGEVFDQWAVSAAHKTLPLPSIVRVTNLKNGRSLVVRINDRGPFKNGRIIDLSRRAAQLLGYEGQGTAQVRVQVLTNQSASLAERTKNAQTQLAQIDTPIKSKNIASTPVASQNLPEVRANQPLPVNIPLKVKNPVVKVPVSPTQIYIQAGAFSDPANANRVRAQLLNIGQIVVSPIPVNGRNLYRVRLGPVKNVAEVDRVLAQVINAGFAGAQTVIEKTNAVN